VINDVKLPPAATHLGKVRTAKQRVQCIIVHATAGTDSRDWLTKTSKPPVSIHVLIAKDGTIYRSTPVNRVAWHAGYGYLGKYQPKSVYGSVNDISLGLELENRNDGKDPYPDVQIDAAGYVIAGWWRDAGCVPLIPHGLIDARKSDPAGLDWSALYQAVYRHWKP
jgi:N-acetyl-anhydromuramyl-L-alanine amidase AmpD